MKNPTYWCLTILHLPLLIDSSEWRQSADNLVRLSQLGTPRLDEVNLPVSSFSECSGSELNYQGLIQSHLPATKPSGQCLPSWQWLVNIAKLRQHALGEVDNLGQLRDLLNQDSPNLARTLINIIRPQWHCKHQE